MSNSSLSETSRSILNGFKSFKKENPDDMLIAALMGKSTLTQSQIMNQQNDSKMLNDKNLNDGLPLINKIFRKQFVPRHFMRKEKAKEAEDIGTANTSDKNNVDVISKFDELDFDKLSFSSDLFIKINNELYLVF